MSHIFPFASRRDRSQPVWSEMVLPVIRVPKGALSLAQLLVFAAVITIVALGVIVPLTIDGLADRLGVREHQYLRWAPLQANRGRILDRNGLTLATNAKSRNVLLSPSLFRAGAVQRAALAKALGIRVDDLESMIAGMKGPSRIAKDVDDVRWATISAMQIPGIGQYDTILRNYPEGDAASPLVGFVNSDGRGQEGVELYFQKDLQERPGMQTVVRGKLGWFYSAFTVEAVDGNDIRLAVDARLQSLAYQRLRDAVVQHNAKSGSAIVLDTVSGELLAVANYPSYQPSDRQTLRGYNLRNRALTDNFEPGTTIMPFTAALAIETKRVTPQTMIDTAQGRINISGITISDAHPHGMLSVSEIIQKSSKVGTVKMALQITPREMWELYNQIGLGQRPQLGFPGLGRGRLRPYKSWRPIEQATMSYGYGLSTSMLQLAQAYTVIARDGELIPVTMLHWSEPAVGQRVLSPETAQAMRKMLQLVAAPGGTSPKAQTMDYTVGGQSGTVNKQEGMGYAPNKYRAWFVGMAPISSPRIVVAVMIDEPSDGTYFGGDIAAPVFSEIVQQSLRTMNVPPDILAN